MKRIKSYKLFEVATSNTKLKNLSWLKSFIEESKSDKHNYKLEEKSGKDGKYLLLSDNKIQMELYDNGQDNNFFLVRIKKDGKIIQDFDKSKSEKEGYSSDEIPSENIIQYIGRYFQKI